jgi:uncharacterized phage protein (TIGR02220 family)
MLWLSFINCTGGIVLANRNIDTEMWSDPKFTDDFTPEDKYFWLFLLTTRYGNISGCFEVTYKQIAREMGYSDDSIKNLVYRFSILHGLITHDEKTNEILIHNWYKYNWNKSPLVEKNIMKFISQIKSSLLREMVTEMYEKYKNGNTVSIGYRYPTNTIPDTNNILNDKEKDLKDLKKSIIDYTNSKLGTNYRYQTKNLNGHLNERIKEGYAFDDFKYVIDVKYAEWHDDPIMSKYLRYDTLFGTKFEVYRNQTTSKSHHQKPKNLTKEQFEELEEITRNKTSKMFGGIK